MVFFFIRFVCYFKAPKYDSGTLTSRFFQDKANQSGNSSLFTDTREVAELHRLLPGDYVIVPSTFDPNEEADYVLRIYSERKNDQVKQVTLRCILKSNTC